MGESVPVRRVLRRPVDVSLLTIRMHIAGGWRELRSYLGGRFAKLVSGERHLGYNPLIVGLSQSFVGYTQMGNH